MGVDAGDAMGTACPIRHNQFQRSVPLTLVGSKSAQYEDRTVASRLGL